MARNLPKVWAEQRSDQKSDSDSGNMCLPVIKTQLALTGKVCRIKKANKTKSAPCDAEHCPRYAHQTDPPRRLVIRKRHQEKHERRQSTECVADHGNRVVW